ncbi:MAG: hypothetical protein M1504_00775 [Candidatus Marsarchaeota archaeon]|nr:hypothetical protein [Candidatus Marsarchaeota archaeon]
MAKVRHKRMVLVIYAIIIIAAAMVILEVSASYDQKQPLVYMNYNVISQSGVGYINNTLSYPIHINYVYCLLPSGQKDEFGYPNNNTLNPGTNTVVDVIASSTKNGFTDNCTRWMVSYAQVSALQANQISNTPNMVVVVRKNQSNSNSV